jgi:hypothetical protein
MLHPSSLLQKNYYKYLLNSILNDELSIAMQVKIKVQTRGYCIFIMIMTVITPAIFQLKGQSNRGNTTKEIITTCFKKLHQYCKTLTIQQENIHHPGKYFNCLQLVSIFLKAHDMQYSATS